MKVISTLIQIIHLSRHMFGNQSLLYIKKLTRLSGYSVKMATPTMMIPNHKHCNIAYYRGVTVYSGTSLSVEEWGLVPKQMSG